MIKMSWKWKIALWILVILLAIWGIRWLMNSISQTDVSIEVDKGINITPEQVASIKAIGEWEFMSIADEQLVDTVRKGLLNDDHLARIYYGTLRLGINMHQVKPGWIKADTNNPNTTSIEVTLPKISMLDRDFIDEARTKSFYEDGRWTHHDRERLYHKAYRMMIARCMTEENLRMARQNGEALFRRMMKAMGYDNVVVNWEE